MAIREVKKFHGDTVRIHVVIPKNLYKRLLAYQKDTIGEPSASGVITSALRQLLDMLGYLKDA